MNDEMAAGALQAIHAFTSLKVPQEISLVGFDDTSLALATQPPLTTIRVEKALMGRLAVEHVIDQINNPGHTPTTVVVPTSLIGRETTAAPPAERVPVEAS
jgi:LacI family transcriptional regulator